MILRSEIYNFHRIDLSRQAGFIVTIYDEDGLRLSARRRQAVQTISMCFRRNAVDRSAATDDIANRILLCLPQASLKRLWPVLELRAMKKGEVFNSFGATN